MCIVCDTRKTFAPGASEATVGMEEKDAVKVALESAMPAVERDLGTFAACAALAGERAAINAAVTFLTGAQKAYVVNLAVVLMYNIWLMNRNTAAADINSVLFNTFLGKE